MQDGSKIDFDKLINDFKENGLPEIKRELMPLDVLVKLAQSIVVLAERIKKLEAQNGKQ